MDKQTRIIASAKRLPIDARQEIVDAIIESIARDQGRIPPMERPAQLIPIGEEVFGCVYDARRKGNGDTLIRNVCAKVLRMDGNSYPAIGKAMGRHPSSVIVMVRRAEEMDAGYFGKDIRDKYVEFMCKTL